MAGDSYSQNRSASPATACDAELLRLVSAGSSSKNDAINANGKANGKVKAKASKAGRKSKAGKDAAGAPKAKKARTTKAAKAKAAAKAVKDDPKDDDPPPKAEDGDSNPKVDAKDGSAKNDGGGSDGEKEPPKPPAQQYVDHAYTDYAVVEEDDLRLLDENSSLLPNPASAAEAKAREKLRGMSCTYGPMKKNSGGVVQPFPGKLLEVLDRTDLVDIIDWMPHGRAFIVKKPKLFTTNVLPRFFKQTKFLSFTRQLNLWAFKRITRGVDAGAYYHELFLRGRPYLAMRMRRQKIKGTGMKLTPNPDGEPDFYNDWPLVPPLNERRVLPPLPPLPSERLGVQAGGPIDRASENMLNALQQQQGDKKQGAANMDNVSENILNALKYGAAGGAPNADNVSTFLGQNDMSNFAAFGNQIHQFAAARAGHQNPSMPMASVNGQQWFPGANQGRYDDLLLAPGVSPFENATRLRNLEQQQAAASGNAANAGRNGQGGPGGEALNPNDPIHDELSAMIRGRSQQAVSAAAMGTGIFPPQQLSSDRLLMERLRDLDRAQQIKREQQDMSMLYRARLFEDMANGGQQGQQQQGRAGAGVAPPNLAGMPNMGNMGQNMGNALGQVPFDRFSYPPAQLPQAHAPAMSSSAQAGANGAGVGAGGPLGKGPRQDPFARYGNDPVESSVKDALREANHLEELALAQRAKARSLALAGALQSRFGGSSGQGGGGGGAAGGASNGGGMPESNGKGAMVGTMDPSQSQGMQMQQNQQQQQGLQQQLQMSAQMGQMSSVGTGGGGYDMKEASSSGLLRNGGASPNGEGGDGAVVGDSRPSFGRPFGRKD